MQIVLISLSGMVEIFRHVDPFNRAQDGQVMFQATRTSVKPALSSPR